LTGWRPASTEVGVVVDGDDDHVVAGRGGLGGVDLDYLEVEPVLGDVVGGWGQPGFGLDLDEPGALQKQKRAAAVAGIVGDGHRAAVLELVYAGDLLGEEPDGRNVGHPDADQAGAALFVELVEVGHVLEGV
jgi:hypothetical protein